MACIVSSNMVLDGLIIGLDASKPIPGTIWKNLVSESYNGTLISSPTYYTNNLGYLTFNGTSSYVALGNVQDGATQYTWAAWINTTATVNAVNNYDAPVIIGTEQGSGDTGDVLMVVNNRIFRYYDESGFLSSYNISSGKNVADGLWHYVVAGKAGTSLKLWVDGVLCASESIGSEASNSKPLRIASSDWNSFNMFNGSISIVQIYNRQLSDAEVVQNFNAHRGRYGV